MLLETIEGMDDDSMVLDEIRSSDTLQMAIGLIGSEELDNPSNLPTTQIIPPSGKRWNDIPSKLNSPFYWQHNIMV